MGAKPVYDFGRIKKGNEPRLSGELWIDALTFNVRREIRTLALNRGTKLAETVFNYQNSDSGILTPRRIVHTQYRVDPGKGLSTTEAVVTFSYGRFTKPDVEVRSSDVHN